MHERGGTAWEGLKARGREKERRRSLLRGAHCLVLPWRHPPPQKRDTQTAGGACTFVLHIHVLTKSSFSCSVWTAVTAAATKRECMWKHNFVVIFCCGSPVQLLMCWDIFLNHLLPVRNRFSLCFLCLRHHKRSVPGCKKCRRFRQERVVIKKYYSDFDVASQILVDLTGWRW